MTFNVIILHSSYSDTNITSCKSYLSPSGNYNWVNSGSYRDTIPNFFNCDSVISIDLTIESCESILFVPNIFSPNGDGQNDILFVRGEYIQEIIFRIYDRWGEKIFESNDINNGWDGNYKGKPLAVGVYTYYVKVKLNDGNDDIKKGNVSLVR